MHARRSSVITGAVLAMILTATPAFAHDSYTVEPGDTLSHIAARSGTTVAVLVEENGLTNPDRIRVGQVLSVPGSGHSGAPATPSGSQPTPAGRYVVAAGDTLSQIAVRLGVSRSALAAQNNITNPNRIFVGQILELPAGGVVPVSGAGGGYPDLLERISNDPARVSLIPIFERWADANDLPVDFVMAVAWHESGWNNGAVSSKGAQGIGQIMPSTGVWIAESLIGDPSLRASRPEDNIRMSARYLRWLIDYLGSEDLALAGYFQGPGAVRNGVWYDSTDLYVASVQAHRQFFLRR